jgi:membrane protein YdbS with pleckstrin-like domain
MKVYESSVMRPYGSLVRGILVLSLFVGVLFAFTLLVHYGGAGRWHSRFPGDALVSPLFLGGTGLFVLIHVPLMLAAFGQSRGSYRVGPTDLEITSGWLHRRTRWIQLRKISDIELSQGPLMRLLGTSDLKIRLADYPCEVLLHGVHDARDLRWHLLDRRDSLSELEAEKEE